MSRPDMKHAIASLRFSLEEGAPYYRQLIDQIQQGIMSGKLSVDDKLPSSRSLASVLGVSRSTTSKAYDQLIAEGILVSEEKRGVFVAAQPILNQVKPCVAVSTGQTQYKSAKWVFDSGVDVSVFPNKEWAASMRRSWLNPDPAVLQGRYETGLPALKIAVADYLYRVRGMACSPEQVIVTAGSRDSLILLHHALSSIAPASTSTDLNLKDVSWWVEDPTYAPMRAVLAQHGKTNVIPIDEDGAVLVESRNAANIALLTPNRQYPLGMAMSPMRRQQWLKRLQSATQSWWLIEDDYDNEFVYQGRVDVPLMQTASLHDRAAERVFFMGSFSKVLFRGLRLGFIVAPTMYMPQLNKSQQALGFSASLPLQPAVADFMQRGGFDRHINRMRRHYRLKRDALLDMLDDCLSPWCHWQKPNGGMHVLLEIKAEWLSARSNSKWDQSIALDLVRENVYLSPLTSHFLEDNKRQGFILGFSGAPIEGMRYTINVVKKWFLDHN